MSKQNRKFLVAGNWKMHGSKLFVQKLIDNLLTEFQDNNFSKTNADCVICPPAVYLPMADELTRNSIVKLGAQDVSYASEGAFTGQISASMLAEFNCKYTIIGHSERRMYNGEDDQTVAKKVIAAKEHNLIPIICVGESLEEYDAGQTQAVISRQVNSIIEQNGVGCLSNSVIAYEPIWAIGTGNTASAEQAQAVHKFIRDLISKLDMQIADQLRIIYGGSVKPSNSTELFRMPDIDGALVGGASLAAKDFIAIYKSGL